MLIGLGLKLLGIMGTLKRLAVGAFQWLTANPVRILIALCLVLAAVGLYQRGQAAKWHRVALERAEALETQRRAFETAQLEAVAKQEAHDRADIAQQIIRNREQAHVHTALEQARVLAVADYKRTHRVLDNGRVTCSSSSGASAGALPSDPGPPADDPAGPELYAITREDLDRASAKAMHDTEVTLFLNTLLQEGRAIRESDLPEAWR